MYTIGGVLYHHGILGQKHGVRNGPPYPLKSGDHSASERKAGWRKSLGGGLISKKNKKKEDDKNLQNERKTQSAEERTADKEKALRSGTATDVLKFQGELTNQELQNALTRINLERQLGQLSSQDVKRAADKVDAIINKIDKAHGWTEKGINAYNTAAKIINAFSAEDDLPIIGQKKPTKDEKKSRELDNLVKQLTAENQKLKNEGEKLRNKDQELKNRQTERNLKNQEKNQKNRSKKKK